MEEHAHLANILRKWAKTGYFLGNLRVAKMSHCIWSVTLCHSMTKSSIILHSSYPYRLVVSYLWYKATLFQVALDILDDSPSLNIELNLIVQEVWRRVDISFYFFLRKRCQWLFFKSQQALQVPDIPPSSWGQFEPSKSTGNEKKRAGLVSVSHQKKLVPVVSHFRS